MKTEQPATQYCVIYHTSFGSPTELQNWLNTKGKEGLRLVAMDGGYFVFVDESTHLPARPTSNARPHPSG